VRSFDALRERPAPRTLGGRTIDGEPLEIDIEGTTLVVAVKPNCDGCRTFLEGDLDAFRDIDVVFVSVSNDDEWRVSSHEVLIAPAVFVALEIRSAPFYVLIDAQSSRVVAEGSLFSPTQVAAEIAVFLPPLDVTEH
jgi:hypothetical protein